MLLRPEIAAIDCQHCERFCYDLRTGEPYRNGRDLIPRGPAGPPCRTDPKACPKVKPGESDLSPLNRQVLQHYLECRASGRFPDDPVVLHHAAILDQLFRDLDNQQLADRISRPLHDLSQNLQLLLRRLRR